MATRKKFNRNFKLLGIQEFVNGFSFDSIFWGKDIRLTFCAI